MNRKIKVNPLTVYQLLFIIVKKNNHNHTEIIPVQINKKKIYQFKCNKKYNFQTITHYSYLDNQVKITTSLNNNNINNFYVIARSLQYTIEHQRINNPVEFNDNQLNILQNDNNSIQQIKCLIWNQNIYSLFSQKLNKNPAYLLFIFHPLVHHLGDINVLSEFKIPVQNIHPEKYFPVMSYDLHPIKLLVASKDYPYWGGAATNSYAMIKYYRNSSKFNTAGFFLNKNPKANYDPDKISNIYAPVLHQKSKEIVKILTSDKLKNFDKKKILRMTNDLIIIYLYSYFNLLVKKVNKILVTNKKKIFKMYNGKKDIIFIGKQYSFITFKSSKERIGSKITKLTNKFHKLLRLYQKLYTKLGEITISNKTDLIDKYINKLNRKKLVGCYRYFKQEPDIIVLKSSMYNRMKYLFPHSKIIYCVAGIINNQLIKPYREIETNKLGKYLTREVLRDIKLAHFNYANSRLTYQIVKKFTNNCNILPTTFIMNQGKRAVLFTPPNNISINEWKRRRYDIGYIVSLASRPIKNTSLVVKIYQKFPLKNKYLIGKGFKESKYTKLSYTTLFHNTNHRKIHKILSQTKILIIPSLYDSFPNVLLEALSNNCNVIVSNNVGGSEYLKAQCVCHSMKASNWIEKINNYLKEPVKCVDSSQLPDKNMFLDSMLKFCV